MTQGRGNYSMGVTEQLIIPEIDFDKIDRTRGMDITIVTTANTDAEGQGPARRVPLVCFVMIRALITRQRFSAQS